jgi:hypothetical protein
MVHLQVSRDVHVPIWSWGGPKGMRLPRNLKVSLVRPASNFPSCSWGRSLWEWTGIGLFRLYASKFICLTVPKYIYTRLSKSLFVSLSSMPVYSVAKAQARRGESGFCLGWWSPIKNFRGRGRGEVCSYRARGCVCFKFGQHFWCFYVESRRKHNILVRSRAGLAIIL